MKFAQNFEIGTSRKLKITEDRVKGLTAIKVSDLFSKQQQRRYVVVCFPVIAMLLFAVATQHQVSAINISTVYSTDFTGDEAPSWDSNGAILTAHFNAAVDIWERLITSPENYQFDFQWDDDITGLGLTTDLQPIDTWIEINPTRQWWIDTTPADNVEFNFPNQAAPNPAQTLFNQLSAGNQSTFFPGTPPPGTLEVGFRGVGQSGFANAPGQPNADANTGFDLLSTVVHEIGHVLGIGADLLGEPGEFNIFPHHVGGLSDVLVAEDTDSGHLGGDGVVPFLMCQGCGAPAVRRLPTATDVLVIAEDQGLNNVRLDRVGSISNGLWSSNNRWIGGAVPNQNQDVYISHGGTVTLNVNGSTRDLLVSPSNVVDVQNNRLNVNGTLTMAGATVNVDFGGTLAVNNLVRGSGTLTDATGSLVRFNNFSSTASGPIVFNGSVGIGFDNTGPSTGSFSPPTGNVWNIAQQLSIGDENTITTFDIDNAATVTSATGRIGTDFNGGGEGIVEIDGPGSSWTISSAFDGRNGLLSITNQGQLQTGSVSLGDDDGEMRAGVDGPGSTWTVNGNVDIGPSTLTGSGQGGLTVQNNALVTVSGDLDVHGTSTIVSFALVQTNGTLDVAGNITSGPFGEVQLTGSTIRAKKLLPFLGTFTWTDGTLELTGQDMVLDSALPASPLAASTTLQNRQALILSGADRDLIVGNSATGQLDLLNTASVQVNNGELLIAEKSGSAGTVRLLSANTSVWVDGPMAVGGTQFGAGGQGQLTVAGDLTVTGRFTYWPTASMIVDSTGTLSADILKRGGGGGLSVNTNGHVRFNLLGGFGANISIGGISAIGIAEGDTGQGMLVRDTGEVYSFRQGWIIGDNAPARVDLINGGNAGGDGFVHLGNQLGSGGTLLNVNGVDGFGFPSELMVLNEEFDSLIVGVADVAVMKVSSQGHVNSSGATIARDLTASGSQATVNGQNSFWEVHGDLIVGGEAQGQLTVENRGLVEIDRTLWIGGAPKERDPDDGAGGTSMPSQVLITGFTSLGITHQDTVVGFDLAGALTVEDRSNLQTDLSAFIAFEPSSKNSSAVVSTRADWKIGKDLLVGNKAKGTLEIQSEGNITVGANPNVIGGNVHIAALPSAGGSMATVSNYGTWLIVHDLFVGDQARGGLAIDTKGNVTVGNNATIADEPSSAGSWVTVSTDGLWNIGADLRVGDQAQGSLQVDSRGQVVVVGNTYLGAGGPDGDGTITLNATNDTVATLSVQGDLFVGGNNIASIGKGRLGMEGSTLVQANRIVNWDTGEFQLAGVVDVGLNSVENQGLFSGQGTIMGKLRNRGDVSPGDSSIASIARINVTGDFRQFVTGSLSMELAGADKGQYDQLISDSAQIAGSLDLQPMDSYVGPVVHGQSDDFVLVLAGSRINHFTNVTYDGAALSADFGPDGSGSFRDHVGNGLFRNVTYTPTQVQFRNLLALHGDIDGNKTVDITDFQQFLVGFTGSTSDWTTGDFNLDNVVDITDFSSYFLPSFAATGGGSYGAAQSVPEPSTMLLIGAGILMLVYLGWRRDGSPENG